MRLFGKVTTISAVVFSVVSFFVTAEMPEKCLELPERTSVCPNQLYKRSPIDVPNREIQRGEVVCICMADFADLRIPATDELARIEQEVSLRRKAEAINLSEEQLLKLIRN